MLYKIDNDFYIKVGGYFVKVEFVYNDNDVDIKPTNDKFECTKNIRYTEINFLSIKGELLAEHKKATKKPERVDNYKFNSKKYER